MEQLSFFPKEREDHRPPVTLTWNPWHGCTKASPGCLHCYMFRRDEAVGKDPTLVQRTSSFRLPLQKLQKGEEKGLYRVPAGSLFYTCFSSDFFHPAADGWRSEAWDMMRTRRDCTFFMITKRPERILSCLPHGWGPGWEHVTIAVTCENQAMADKRLPVYLSLPLFRGSVMIEPMLTPVDLQPFFDRYPGKIQGVSIGGESGPQARPCHFDWVLSVHRQCLENGARFSYHQTGALLIKDGKTYHIPRKLQHDQARKAGLDSP